MARPAHQPVALSENHAAMRTGVENTVIARLQASDLFREYQQAFETTLRLPLVLRAAGSFQTPLQGSKQANPFCSLLMQSNKTCASCLQLQQSLEEAATLRPKTLQCYAGLSETVVPVLVGHKVIGYLQTGQVFLRAPAKKHFTRFTYLLPANSADRQKLQSAYFKTRIVSPQQYQAIIRLLTIFAEHLAAVSNQMLRREASAELPMLTKARQYITEHQGVELSLTEVARAVNVSAFYFCKVFKKATGLTFTEYLARERIESVKLQLLSVHLRVSEAAFAAGFQSLSQFNRVFRRIAGETPSSYRDRLHGLDPKPSGSPGFVRAA